MQASDEEQRARNDHGSARKDAKPRQYLSALPIPQAPSSAGVQTASDQQWAQKDHNGAHMAATFSYAIRLAYRAGGDLGLNLLTGLAVGCPQGARMALEQVQGARV